MYAKFKKVLFSRYLLECLIWKGVMSHNEMTCLLNANKAKQTQYEITMFFVQWANSVALCVVKWYAIQLLISILLLFSFLCLSS